MASGKNEGAWVVSIPVVVSDRKVATDWYVNKLGLKLIDNEAHWVTIGGEKGSRIHLCQASENFPTPIPLEPGASGMVIAVPGDFVTECKRIEAAGVTFTRQPEKSEWGWYAVVRDPDGNEHNLCPSR